jgi:hypothetical protein
MALYPIHAQIAAVEAAVKANPTAGALVAALATLVALRCAAPALECDEWTHLGYEENRDSLTRAMEGLMP